MIKKVKSSRRTPINSKYETCLNTYVKLLVYIDSDIHSITKLLSITPSFAQNKGDVFENSHGRVRRAKLTFWSLSSEGQVLSKDVRHHLQWLLALLSEKKQELAELQKKTNVTMTVNCTWWSSGSGGPTLWPEEMLLLSELNLECTFDIYFDE